jgi:LPXTG-site transpeptidase (sortase) family protein
MNVPSNANDVGLYRFGTQPGEIGNTVVDGHLDTYTSSNGVFSNLDKLKSGDDVYVVDAQNKLIHYRVSHVAVFAADSSAPLQSIFGTSGQAHLNLITCAGAWDNNSHQYTQRRVVFTDLVQ